MAHYVTNMHLTTVQDQAIAARTALIVGAKTFDRLFAGIRFDEVEGDILYVFAIDEERAAEIEDKFALHISIIATSILKRAIGIVLVLPKQLA
jgi:hypothetical protein